MHNGRLGNSKPCFSVETLKTPETDLTKVTGAWKNSQRSIGIKQMINKYNTFKTERICDVFTCS